MKIIYYDGSELTCSTIYVADKTIIADDIYEVPLLEILRIEDDTEGE